MKNKLNEEDLKAYEIIKKSGDIETMFTFGYLCGQNEALSKEIEDLEIINEKLK